MFIRRTSLQGVCVFKNRFLTTLNVRVLAASHKPLEMSLFCTLDVFPCGGGAPVQIEPGKAPATVVP